MLLKQVEVLKPFTFCSVLNMWDKLAVFLFKHVFIRRNRLGGCID